MAMMEQRTQENDDDRKLRLLLKSWAVADKIIDRFIDDDVSVESLKFLSDKTIHELIPTRGPRDTFYHHFDTWKNTNISNFEDDDEDENLDDGEPLAKRSKTEVFLDQILNSPNINELHAYLKLSIPGLSVLGYWTKRGELDNYSRDILSEQVIYKALQGNYDRRISRNEFDDFAKSIVAVFSTESEATWYDVVLKGNSSVVEGRLRFKYYSVRRTLYKANLISRESIRRDLDLDAEDELNFDLSDLDGLIRLNDSTSWDDIEEAWNATKDCRLKFRKSVSITHYIEKFPLLQHTSGWKLIVQDGVESQPCLEFMETLWEDYSKFIIHVVRKQQKRFLVKDPVVPPGEEHKIGDYRFMTIISKLPSFFKVRTLPKSHLAAKSDKGCYRPSMQEIKDSFCLFVPDIALLEEKLNQRREKLTKYKYSLQPVPVVIGTLERIKQCFIVIDNNRWEVSSPSEAVWGVFKMCFGLDASYPVEARHLYLYLQQTMLRLKISASDYKRDKGLRSYLAARVKEYENFVTLDV